MRQVINESDDGGVDEEFNVQNRSKQLPERDNCCAYDDTLSPKGAGKKIFELEFVKKEKAQR